MKKHLLTSFLLPLLIGTGSPSSAWSKVAESPRGESCSLAFSPSFNAVPCDPYPSTDTLRIGDRIPTGIVLNQAFHLDSEPIQLDKLEDKFIVLQFWAPSCTGSIASLPKIEELLSGYRDQIELIQLTSFPEKNVAELVAAYPSLQNLESPQVVDASEMRSLFPHSVIPHFVILDPKGEVLAITGQEDMTKTNLDLLTQKGESAFRFKEDRKIKLVKEEKLISESGQIPEKNIWFQSALTGYIPNVGGSLIQNFEGQSHIRIVNLPLYYLYRLAYSERDLVDYYGRNRMIALGFGEEELFTETSGADYREWMEGGNHVFGYELIAPPSQNPYALMREDLKRYFPNIQASIETQKRTVYALIQQEGRSYPKAQEGPKSYQVNPLQATMSNYPLQGFVYHLNTYFYQTSPYPILNATGIDYPIDLSLEGPIGNVEKLRAELQKKGLDLIEREEEINVLVLKKTGETKPLY